MRTEATMCTWSHHAEYPPHRVIQMGRDLRKSLVQTLVITESIRRSDLVAQGFTRLRLEHLQRCRLHHASVQAVLLLDIPHGEKVMSYVYWNLFCFCWSLSLLFCVSIKCLALFSQQLPLWFLSASP